DGNSRGRIRKVRGHLCNPRIQPLAKYRAEFIIFPPRLNNMMVGENASIAHDKASAEEIGAHFRCAALHRVSRISIAILERLTVGVDGNVPQWPPGRTVQEVDGYVEQTNARGISSNHIFCCLRFRLHPPKKTRGLLKLLAQGGHFRPVSI